MKKILALLLVFLMLFSVATLIAGCEDSGRKKNNSSKKDDDDEEEEDDDDETPTEPQRGNQVGDLLISHEVELIDGNGATGDTLDPSATGKITIINFWGTWCSPCVAELPHFDEAARHYGDSVMIVAVHSTDGRDEAPDFIAEHYADSPLVFAWDSEETPSEYYYLLGGKDAYPYTLVLNEKGIITDIFIESMGYEEICDAIEKAKTKDDNNDNIDEGDQPMPTEDDDDPGFAPTEGLVTEPAVEKIVFSDKLPSKHENGWEAKAWRDDSSSIYFNLWANDLPYSSDWSIAYEPVSSEVVTLIRDGSRYGIGGPGTKQLIKYSGNSYCLSFDKHITQSLFPLEEGDVVIVDGSFTNPDNGYTINFSKFYIQCKASGLTQFSSTAPSGIIESGSVKPAPSTGLTIESGKLIVATNATFPPYEYWEAGKIIGADIEIAQELANRMGLALELRNVEFDEMFLTVRDRKADITLAAITSTSERLEIVDFSQWYYVNEQIILVPEGSPINDVDDLWAADSPYIVGAVLDTTSGIYAASDLGEDRVRLYNTPAELTAAMRAGKVDCAMVQAEWQFEVLNICPSWYCCDTYSLEYYTIGVSKENPALRNAVTDTILQMKNDGTIDTIIAKYVAY